MARSWSLQCLQMHWKTTQYSFQLFFHQSLTPDSHRH